jgi:hypothetical protein
LIVSNDIGIAKYDSYRMDTYKETALKILASERLFYHPELYNNFTSKITLKSNEEEGSLHSRDNLIENIAGLLSNEFDLNIVKDTGVISIVNEYPLKIKIKTFIDEENDLWYFINFYAKIGESANIPKDVVNVINNYVATGIVLWDGDNIVYTNGFSFTEDSISIPLLHFIYKSFLIFNIESEEILLNTKNKFFDYQFSNIKNWSLDDIKAALESYVKKVKENNLHDLISVNNSNLGFSLTLPLAGGVKKPFILTLSLDKVNEGRVGIMIHCVLPMVFKKNKVATVLQKINEIPVNESKINHSTLWLAGQWCAKDISGESCYLAYKYFLNAEYKDIIDIEAHLEGVIREIYQTWQSVNFQINFESLVSRAV